ncbi:MAG: LysR family transcriptional regulator [Pseudomonadota bacterium]
MTTERADTWGDMPYFLALARTESLRAAADRLNSTHATVRRRLGALEAACGARLFDRSVDGFALTDAGRAILPRAEAAEREVLAARRQLAGLDQEAAGNVRVTAPPSLAFDVLPPIFAAFSAANPQISLDVGVTNRFQDLARHEVDVAIRVAFEVSDDVVGRRVLQYAKGIYASRRYVEEVLPNAGPEGAGLTWIGWGEPDPRPEWVRQSPFPQARIAHSVSEGVMHAGLVRQHMGMSILPCYVERFMPDLQLVPGTAPVMDRSIWLLLHGDLRRTTRVRLFVDFLSERLRAERAMFLGPLA